MKKVKRLPMLKKVEILVFKERLISSFRELLIIRSTLKSKKSISKILLAKTLLNKLELLARKLKKKLKANKPIISKCIPTNARLTLRMNK
jgi:hypothetical protein